MTVPEVVRVIKKLGQGTADTRERSPVQAQPDILPSSSVQECGPLRIPRGQRARGMVSVRSLSRPGRSAPSNLLSTSGRNAGILLCSHESCHHHPDRPAHLPPDRR